MINKCLQGIDTFSRVGAYLSALFMVLIVALISVEIVLRTFFKTSTYISSEYSGYLMVAVVLAGLSYTLRTDGHIRITILMVRFPPQVQRYLEAVAIFMALLITGFICYHATLMAVDAYNYEMTADSISQTPLYLPQALIPVGLLGLCTQLLAQLLRKLFPCFQNP
ncbi:MAG: TRAP transporter small permease subunit [Desulfopila sp.]